MSKNIETYSLISDMRDDLMRCYREVAPNCLSQTGAYRRTVKHPARRFYVTRKQVSQRLSAYLSGNTDVIEKLKSSRKRMYKCLLEIVYRLSQMPEHQGKSLWKLCDIAIKQPAPEFFITPDHMKRIFMRVRGRHYDENGKLLKQYTYDYGDRYKGKYTRI